MKIICTTCGNLGTIRKRFVTLELFDKLQRPPAWRTVFGCFENFGTHDNLREIGKQDTFDTLIWPRIRCETCEGTGWVERVDNFSQIKASVNT